MHSWSGLVVLIFWTVGCMYVGRGECFVALVDLGRRAISGQVVGCCWPIINSSSRQRDCVKESGLAMGDLSCLGLTLSMYTGSIVVDGID